MKFEFFGFGKEKQEKVSEELGALRGKYVVEEDVDLGTLMEGAGRAQAKQITFAKGQKIGVRFFDASEYDKYADLNAAEDKFGPDRIVISVSNQDGTFNREYRIPESELEGKRIAVTKIK